MWGKVCKFCCLLYIYAFVHINCSMLKSNKIPSKREREGVESRNVQEQWTIYLLFLSDYNPFPRNLDLIDLKLSLVNNFYLFRQSKLKDFFYTFKLYCL